MGIPKRRRSGNLGEGDTFVDQHDRNIFADWVENLTVGANQAPVQLFSNGFLRLVFQCASLNDAVDFLNQHIVRENHCLFGFRTAQNGQEILIKIHFFGYVVGHSLSHNLTQVG